MRNSVALWAALVAACSGGNGGLNSPSSSLQITTQTSGQPGTETYTVAVDGGDSTAIGISATLTLPAEPGTHLVQLSGLPAGCTVADENPRNVTVTAGET